jgi:hypothetical protein
LGRAATRTNPYSAARSPWGSRQGTDTILPIVIPVLQHSLYVLLSFLIRRYAIIAAHGLSASVVSGQSEECITAKTIKQEAKMSNPPVDVIVW